MWDHYIPTFSKRTESSQLIWVTEKQNVWAMFTPWKTMQMPFRFIRISIRKSILVGHSMGGYVALAFAELYPEYVKGLALLNSTARADSEERKQNRDRAIKAVKHSFINFISLSIANLFEGNRERLVDEIENVKNKALKTPPRYHSFA
jgi:predicted alpha/beta hydrolase family esterase